MQNTMLAAGPATHQATDPGGGHTVPGHNVAAMGKSASPHIIWSYKGFSRSLIHERDRAAFKFNDSSPLPSSNGNLKHRMGFLETSRRRFFRSALGAL